MGGFGRNLGSIFREAIPSVLDYAMPYVNRAMKGDNFRDVIGDALGQFGRRLTEVSMNRLMPLISPGQSAADVYSKGLSQINQYNRTGAPMSMGGAPADGVELMDE